MKARIVNLPEIFSNYFTDGISKNIALKLAQRLEEGNICMDLDDKADNVQYLTSSQIRKSPFVTDDPEQRIKPFVLYDDSLLYLHRYFRYESIIIGKISELISFGELNRSEFIDKYLSCQELISGILNIRDLSSKWQNVATLSSFINSLTFITGGPGTGKTTSISRFIHIFLMLFPDSKIVLTAPTGKAAARMSESLLLYSERIEDPVVKENYLKIKSKTLHRLLGIHKNNTVSSLSDDLKIPYDVVIVDESSMIDISLMGKLFHSTGSDTKMIFLGDKNQLSPIGAGSVFGDLCSTARLNQFPHEDFDLINKLADNEILTIEDRLDVSERSILSGNVIELQNSYRFSDTEGIGKLSRSILNGEIKELNKYYISDNTADTDVFITENIENEFAENLLDLYEEYAQEEDIKTAFSKLNRIKVLCSVTEGKYSVGYFNRLIETRLKEKRLINPDTYFYDKQAIIITENDYQLGLFNGDIGIVRSDKESGGFYAYFQLSELKKVSCNEIKRFSTAYAMSIHKSQGSEFDNAVVVLNDVENTGFLTRELIYTAVTRAKKRVLIISDRDVLTKALRNKISRISGIKYRINKLEVLS
ncbi:MAG: exodeoxyribonuclease V subunit alpha [Saprospiraceae bacterium]|nr:exodeoxyribonuclease V subunit alpha [Saprospiraceae bacterium]